MKKTVAEKLAEGKASLQEELKNITARTDGIRKSIKAAAATFDFDWDDPGTLAADLHRLWLKAERLANEDDVLRRKIALIEEIEEMMKESE